MSRLNTLPTQGESGMPFACSHFLYVHTEGGTP